MKFRIIFPLFLVALLMSVLAACSSDSGGKSKEKDKTTIRRTVVMYVNAQNSLGYKNFNKGDSTELMAGTQFMNARDQILLFVDDAQKPRVYRLYKGCTTPQVVRRYASDVNSSDAGVLQELLEWTKSTYPSESYGLVMWSHSDGWVPSWSKDYSGVSVKSFGLDVGQGGNMATDKDVNGNYGYTMDISDMAQAIEESGIHPKYIFFDSCMMQCIEVDYALRNATDYVIASPISTPAIGGNYTSLVRNGLFAEDPSQIAASYYTYLTTLPASNVYSDFGMVVSCVKTAELETLAAATKRCLAQIPAYNVGVDNDTIYNWPDMKNVTYYSLYEWSSFYRPHFYDLSSAMCKMLSADQYTEWRKVLENCITYYNGTTKFYVGEDRRGNEIYLPVNHEDYCGISAFIPQMIYSQNAEYCIFGDLNQCFSLTEWYDAAGWKDAGW